MNVEQQANVDFARYRTFDFADTEVKTNGDGNPLLRSPIAQDSTNQLIASELAKRGLRQAESNPDVLVTTHTFVERAERTVHDAQPAAGYTCPYAVGYRGAYLPINYGYWYSPAYYSRPRTEQYRVAAAAAISWSNTALGAA